MVDALRRAHAAVDPLGWVVDLHPTAVPSSIEVGALTTGLVDAADAPQRHAHADAALATTVADRLFVVDRTIEFTFHTYGDTLEELRDYIVENWRNARLSDDTLRRTREALRATPGTRPRAREQVRVTRLRVC
jgi:hypothetical protein